MPSSPNKINTLTIGIIIVLLVAMGQFNNTLFIPSLPHMRVPLHTSDSLLQLSVTITLCAFGASQLIYGPLSDFYGRRKVVLIGLAIFLLGNLLCLLAQSGPALLIGKVVTGFGVGCVGPIARAIARDLSAGKQLVKLMGTLVMFMSITPAISPIIGGAIQEFVNWRGNFFALSVIGLLFLPFVYWKLPETNAYLGKDSNRLNFKTIYSNYLVIMTDAEFLRMALLNMLGFAAELVFLLSASYVLQNSYHLAPLQFGLVPLAIVPCVIIGNFIVSKLSAIFNVKTITAIGVGLIFLGSLLMLSSSFIAPAKILTFIIPMMLVALGEGIVTPSSTARCMDLYGKKAGYAGAAVGAIAMLGAGFVIALSSLTPIQSVFHIATSLVTISVILIVLCLFNFLSSNKE